MFGDLVNLDYGFSPESYNSSFNGVGDLFKGFGSNLGSMDWNSILKGVGDVGGLATQGYGLLQQLMGPGQNRAPRLDRGSIGSGFQTPKPSASTASGVAKDIQAKGISEGAVSPEFYRNYLPPEFMDLPPEVLMQLIQQGNQQGGQSQASPLGGA